MDQPLNSSWYCCDLSHFSVCNCLLSLGSSVHEITKAIEGGGWDKKRRREGGINSPFVIYLQHKSRMLSLSFPAYFGMGGKKRWCTRETMCPTDHDYMPLCWKSWLAWKPSQLFCHVQNNPSPWVAKTKMSIHTNTHMHSLKFLEDVYATGKNLILTF